MPSVRINIKKDPEFDEFQVTKSIEGIGIQEPQTYYTDDEEDAVYTALREAEEFRRMYGEPFFTKMAIRRIQKYEPGFTGYMDSPFSEGAIRTVRRSAPDFRR